MSHGYRHAAARYDRAFRVGIALNLAYVLAEVGAGLSFHSMALLSDAGHNLGDVLALLLAWGAFWLSGAAPTESRTYGLKRATILAAMISALTLCMALGAVIWEAAQRLVEPHVVEGLPIILVAAIGVAVNGFTAWMFRGKHAQDLNIQGAFLHMAADALVSLGVMAAGLLIYLTGWLWIDPTVSLAVALLILISGFGLLRESFELAVDAVPRHVDIAEVRNYLLGLNPVREVHDLHVWAMSTQETALTAHLVLGEALRDDSFIQQISAHMLSRFSIQHSTIQVEYGDQGAACISTGGACDLVRSNAIGG